jgi:hypothetical protein
MNRAQFLATVIVFLLPYAQANAQDLDARTPISFELNLDSRATYETLAERAGLNVVFVRDPRPKPAQPFGVENKTPAEALDLLAKQTATFWTPWGRKTILVAEDTEQNRRDYDRQFVQVLPVANRPASEIVDELRARGFKQIMAAGNAIVVRDSAAQVRVAARAASPDAAPPVFDLNGVFVAESGQNWRTPESRRVQLKIKPTASASMNVNESSQTVFARLAENAGVNILFGRGFLPANAKLVVKDVGFFDALDLLALTTNTFWQPLNETTIMVFADTEQNRRDFQAQMVETIYLPAGITTTRLNEIMNALRTVAGFRGIFQSQSAKAIVIRDTPGRVTLAESLIAEISGAPIRTKPATDGRTMFGENGTYFHTAASDRDQLQIKTKEPTTFSSTSSSKEAFEKLADVAGLQVLFGRDFPSRTVDFRLQNVDVIEALDFLSLQSGTFWQPLDARTILVMDDTPQNRRSFDTHVLKTIYLPREISINGLNEILNVLRTSLSIRGAFAVETPWAILIHDIPQRTALVETLVDHLNTLPTPAKSVQIPAPHYAESAIFGIAAAVRSELSVKTSAPVSIDLNQNARATYEALADIAGIKVNFSPDFVPGNPQPFRLERVDALDALDYFSLVTGNAWKVVDSQTILVFPDTPQNRQGLETQTAKSFYIAYKPSTNTVNGVMHALRTALLLRNAHSGDGFITVQDTPQRMRVVEKVVESLDRKPLGPANPEFVSIRIVLSAYRDNVEIRTESHVLDVEVGADRATLRSGSTVPVSLGGGPTVMQQVGIQIDSEVRSAVEGRYKVPITITKRDVYDANLARPLPQGVPSTPLFYNVTFAGTLVLGDGELAPISGVDSVRNETWRADVTLTVKKQGTP